MGFYHQFYAMNTQVQPSTPKVEMPKLKHEEVQQTLNSLEIDGLEDTSGESHFCIDFNAEEAVSVLKQAVSAFCLGYV